MNNTKIDENLINEIILMEKKHTRQEKTTNRIINNILVAMNDKLIEEDKYDKTSFEITLNKYKTGQA